MARDDLTINESKKKLRIQAALVHAGYENPPVLGDSKHL